MHICSHPPAAADKPGFGCSLCVEMAGISCWVQSDAFPLTGRLEGGQPLQINMRMNFMLVPARVDSLHSVCRIGSCLDFSRASLCICVYVCVCVRMVTDNLNELILP